MCLWEPVTHVLLATLASPQRSPGAPWLPGGWVFAPAPPHQTQALGTPGAQQWDCWIIRQFYFHFFKESPHCSPSWLY